LKKIIGIMAIPVLLIAASTVVIEAAIAEDLMTVENTMSPNMPTGQAGTTLTANKTATGYWIRTYDWTITKTANPSTLNLNVGQEGQISYNITAVKSESYNEAYFVNGTIMVTNVGAVTTENLKLVDQVQYKIGAGQFQDLPDATQTVIPVNQLAPGETGSYYYSIAFTPVAGAVYRNIVKITITNHSGHIGEEFGPTPKADFSLPPEPTILNDAVQISDSFEIPAGLIVVSSTEPIWPQIIIQTASFAFDLVVKGNTAGNYVINNRATLTGDTINKDANATVTVNITNPYISTNVRTIGYWKNWLPKFSDNTVKGYGIGILATWNTFDSLIRTDTGTHTKTDMIAIINSATAVDMSDMLKAQLLSMMLNVQAGYITSSTNVNLAAIPGATTLFSASTMNVGNILIFIDGNWQSWDRPNQEIAKNVLDAMNNNLIYMI